MYHNQFIVGSTRIFIVEKNYNAKMDELQLPIFVMIFVFKATKLGMKLCDFIFERAFTNEENN